jgi:hypothetical protein
VTTFRPGGETPLPALLRRGPRDTPGRGYPWRKPDEVAREVRPDARVVYVDRDPLVVTHARALAAHPGGPATSVLRADLRAPDAILAAPAVADLTGPGEPVALVLGAVLHFVDDAEEPHAAVRHLLEPLAPGSMLIVSHVCHDSRWVDDEDRKRAEDVTALYRETVDRLTPRATDGIEAFFAGLELLPPGLVPCAAWGRGRVRR